jgi:hypothetical protein
MRAEVKIPKGWKRVPTGQRCKDGDLIFCYTDGVQRKPSWEAVYGYERVYAFEVVIRKIGGSK